MPCFAAVDEIDWGKAHMKKEAAVLVVDDEVKILDIVQCYLEKDGFTALTATSGRQALALMQQRPVSVLILDLMLPDMSGEEICRTVRKSSNVPIIMMTAKTDEESIIGGLALGADDYVTKPFSPRQLMARVSAALRRSSQTHAPIPEAEGNLQVDRKNRRVSKNGSAVKLTPSEYKILELLATTPQKTFSRDEIILAVKTDDYDGFDRTIDSHIKNLRHKIEDDPKSPRYVVTAHGFGYRYGGST